jgi:transposase InsO family protein
MYIGKHCTCYDVKRTLNNVIKYRGIDIAQLIIRSDNGSQFKAKNLLKHEKELEIEHEFGIKHNPNSQAYVESFDVLKKHLGVSKETPSFQLSKRI